MAAWRQAGRGPGAQLAPPPNPHRPTPTRSLPGPPACPWRPVPSYCGTSPFTHPHPHASAVPLRKEAHPHPFRPLFWEATWTCTHTHPHPVATQGPLPPQPEVVAPALPGLIPCWLALGPLRLRSHHRAAALWLDPPSHPGCGPGPQ